MPLSPRDFAFVPPPSPQQWQGPQTNFDWLGNLAQTYYEGQMAPLKLQMQRMRLQALQEEFGGGNGAGTGPSASAGTTGTATSAEPTAKPAADTGTQYASVGDVFKHAMFGQESSYGRNPSTSVTGNIGPMQISKSLFGEYAQRGENIHDFNDNLRVGNRILDDYLKKYNGDWQRAAVAYYSGEGNVAPAGSPTPYKRNISPRPGVPGPSTAGYIAQVGAKMRLAQNAPATLASAPPLTDGGRMPVNIEVRPRSDQLNPTDRAAVDRMYPPSALAAPPPAGTSAPNAPAPNEPYPAAGSAAAATTGPPFARTADATVNAAASSPSASGPATINLASRAPMLGGLMPSQPAATVTPTSSAEVAGTLGQGQGTQPAGTPIAGPITPQGRESVSQGPGQTPQPTTRMAQAAPMRPEDASEVQDLNAQIRDKQMDVVRAAKRAALLPELKPEVETLQKQVDDLRALRQNVLSRLGTQQTEQRRIELETKAQGIRGREAAELKTYTDEFNDVQKKGDEATRAQQTLRLAKGLMNDPSFDSGTFSGNKLAYKRFMVALGLGDSAQALTQEGFNKAVSEAILEQLRSLGGLGLGQVKAKEFETMTKAAQSQENTPATNRLLTEMGLRMAERWQIPLSQMAREYRRQHGGQLDAGWDDLKARYLETTPLFTDPELRDVRRIAPIYARTPQEAHAKGWHEGEPLEVPAAPGSPPGTPDRIITHLRAGGREGPEVRVAPAQQER
jgi:hypothetical protein